MVHLTIMREGEDKLLEFDVTREKITIKSATGKMLDNGVAYIQITTFGDKTTPELLAALNELMPQKSKRHHPRLRNNGGGYLQTAVEVTSQFIGDAWCFTNNMVTAHAITFDVIPGGMATGTNIPMVVLPSTRAPHPLPRSWRAPCRIAERAKLVGVTYLWKRLGAELDPPQRDNGAVRIKKPLPNGSHPNGEYHPRDWAYPSM